MQEFWIFGYGSLMWRPGFSFLEHAPARIHGVHRALCVYSHIHRGTPARPGLVLGLDRGGSCRGRAFRVAPGDWRRVVGYLRAREQVTHVYREHVRTIRLERGERRSVRALVYLVDHTHPQYCPPLDLQDQAGLIRQGHGRSGANIDYLRNTVMHLRAAGISDHGLEKLLAAVEDLDMVAADRAMRKPATGEGTE